MEAEKRDPGNEVETLLDRLDRPDRAEFYLGDHDRPGRPDRPSTFRHCFHIIAWIVCTLFRVIGATRAIGVIIWKQGLRISAMEILL